MKKVLFLAAFVVSATAVMAAENSSWPVGDTSPATFPCPSQENVYPVFPEAFPVFPQDCVFPVSYPVYPQDSVYPEPEQSWPTEP